MKIIKVIFVLLGMALYGQSLYAAKCESISGKLLQSKFCEALDEKGCEFNSKICKSVKDSSANKSKRSNESVEERSNESTKEAKSEEPESSDPNGDLEIRGKHPMVTVTFNGKVYDFSTGSALRINDIPAGKYELKIVDSAGTTVYQKTIIIKGGQIRQMEINYRKEVETIGWESKSE